jgi:hypothetical protein
LLAHPLPLLLLPLQRPWVASTRTDLQPLQPLQLQQRRPPQLQQPPKRQQPPPQPHLPPY